MPRAYRFKGHKVFTYTIPLKSNMEHNHGGLVQIIFHSKWVICRFHGNLPGCKFFMFTKRRQHGEKIHS